MNVVLIHYSAPPVVGGVETILARQAHLLARAGHRVKIIAGRGTTWDAHVPVETLPLIDPRHPLVLRAKASLDTGRVSEDFSRLAGQIESDLRRMIYGWDRVILHDVASLHLNLALTQALYHLSQTPGSPQFILWHHNLAWATPRYQSELYPGHPWELICTAWPGAIQVAVSQMVQQQLSTLTKLSSDKIHVISAGLSLPDFLGFKPATTALVEKMHLAQAAPLILLPVRITRRKNLEQAITTLAFLKKTYPEATLVITGPARGHNPANQEYLQALHTLCVQLQVTEQVHFLADYEPEGLPEDSLTDLYRLADGVLLTSREEGFGMPILEAGLSGIPIFCTDLPSLKSLAQDAACYFSPNDPPEKVSDLIVQRLKNDPVYAMRVRVRHQYTWEVVYYRQIAPLLEEK